MLTPHDELPVHQSPYPFSQVPSSSYSFDDGFYFGVFSPEEEAFLFQGLRVNVNNDMVGGYAGIMVGGRQYTARFKRPWRPHFATAIGPYGFEVVKPFETIHLHLYDNPSGLSFDLEWRARAPAFEEAHHYATSHGRTTTDQTRYSQSGTAEGWILFEGRRMDVTPGRWWASRDHSWGLYADRAPLAPEARYVRREAPAKRRALRFWTVFSSPDVSGFYGFHEDETGGQLGLNDVFGTPFEGALARSTDGPVIPLVAVRHRAALAPGTAKMRSAMLELTDDTGAIWRQELESVGTPWWPHTIGYGAGSWKDGGSMATYAGTDDVVLEWDDFDFAEQPFEHVAYDGRTIGGGAPHAEHLCRVTTTAPDGTVSTGAGQTELFIDPPYLPYGLTS